MRDLTRWWPNCSPEARATAQAYLIKVAEAENDEANVGSRPIDFRVDYDIGLVCLLPRIEGDHDDAGADLLAVCNLVDLTKRWLARRTAPHPLSPLVRDWQLRRPLLLEQRNSRSDPILPKSILPSRHFVKRRSTLKLLASDQPRGWLPRLAPGEVERDPDQQSVAPLFLWDLSYAPRTDRAKRGVPLAARIFVDVLLDVAPDDWEVSASRGVVLPPQRFGAFLKRLYVSGPKYWDSRRLPAMLEAFAILESPETRISYFDPDSQEGGDRRVVVPIDIPRNGRLNDWVRFAVHVPPGATNGPLIDRPALIEAASHTAAAWRLLLSLSAYWHQPGLLRRPVRGGQHWMQVRSWNCYGPISDARLMSMAFPLMHEPQTASTSRSRSQRAREALTYLADNKYVEFREETPKSRRIRPGRRWCGWHDGASPPVLELQPGAVSRELGQERRPRRIGGGNAADDEEQLRLGADTDDSPLI